MDARGQGEGQHGHDDGVDEDVGEDCEGDGEDYEGFGTADVEESGWGGGSVGEMGGHCRLF